MYYKEKKFNIGKITVIVLSIIILAIIVGITITIIRSNMSGNNNSGQENRELPLPTLELTLNTEAPNQDSVKVTAKGSVEGNYGIESITLQNSPEGGPKVINGDIGEFEITKNGEYKFIIKDNNGQVVEKTLIVENVKPKAADKPYIPEGFTVVEDDFTKGIIIEDKFKNQFVWIPVPENVVNSLNKHINNPRYGDLSPETPEFTNSIVNNRGFYISRFEISQGVNSDRTAFIAKSIPGVIPWTSISFNEALAFAGAMTNAYGYKGVKTTLPSVYAWEAIIEVANSVSNNTFANSTKKGNHSGSLRKTGQTATDFIYNIYDLAGNVREWTTESLLIGSSNNGVLSGTEIGSESDQKVPILRGGNAKVPGSMNSSTSPSASTGSRGNAWGFRVVLYKSTAGN